MSALKSRAGAREAFAAEPGPGAGSDPVAGAAREATGGVARGGPADAPLPGGCEGVRPHAAAIKQASAAALVRILTTSNLPEG